jgi:hypothetical protein
MRLRWATATVFLSHGCRDDEQQFPRRCHAVMAANACAANTKARIQSKMITLTIMLYFLKTHRGEVSGFPAGESSPVECPPTSPYMVGLYRIN